MPQRFVDLYLILTRHVAKAFRERGRSDGKWEPTARDVAVDFLKGVRGASAKVFKADTKKKER